MNFPFDYPKHMIYPDGDRAGIRKLFGRPIYSWYWCVVCNLFENFLCVNQAHDRIVSYRDVIPGRKRN